MKKLLLIFAALIMISNAHAQTPDAFNYQAVARDNTGKVIQNTLIAVRITIHDATAGGTSLYAERDTATTNQFGLFSVMIGKGALLSGSFTTINWGSANKYLQVEFDPTGQTAYLNMGTTQLISVPYAKVSDVSLTPWAINGTAINNTNTGNVGIGTSSSNGHLTVVNNGSGLGAPSIYTSNTNAAGIGIYITTSSTDATAVFTNSTGAAGHNATIAKFFDGGASDLVRIDNGNNILGGHIGFISLYGQNTGNTNGGFVCGDPTHGLVLGNISSGLFGFIACAYTASSEGYLAPYFDDISSLGSSSLKWTAVWSYNGSIQTSDERLKENVRPIAHGLNELMSLKPVSYQWKEERARLGSGSNLGFLAQDLEKVLPEVVVHTQLTQEEIDHAKKNKDADTPGTDTYGVKYSEMIPVLVKAIQEQQAEIKSQHAEIEAFEIRVNSQHK